MQRRWLRMTDAPGGDCRVKPATPGGSIPLLPAQALTPSVNHLTTLHNGKTTMALGIPASMIGIIVSGDVSGLTIYTDRYGRKVAFPKAPPKEPPTDFQIYYRSRFRTAQQNYMALTAFQKKAYEDLTKAASLCMTGQNLWIHVALKHTFTLLDTLQTQHGITVVPPEAI